MGPSFPSLSLRPPFSPLSAASFLMAPFSPPVLLTEEERDSLHLSMWGRRRLWPLWGRSRVDFPEFPSFVILVQSSSLFATSWTAASQASLSLTASWSFESVLPANHLILCYPLLLPSLFPSIRVFSNELAFRSGGQSIGASALVFLINIQVDFL